MSDRLLLVEGLDVEYGDQIFGSYDIEGIQKYLEKLRAFGVNSWEASEIYAGLMIAFEIDADDFSAFYKSYIQSMQYQEDREEEEELSEEEIEVSHKIYKLLEKNPNYINSRGYIAIAYI